MKAEFLRDAAMTGVIFGFFGMAWFGWAQEAPPDRAAQRLLAFGSALSALLAVGAGFVSWRHWHDGSAVNAGTGPLFGIVVGIEFALAGIGAAILAARKHSALIAPWIAFVVGVHFLPLAPILRTPLLYVAGFLITAGALVSVRLARGRGLTPSYVAGPTTGSLLLVCGTVSLIQALTAY